MSRPPAPDSRLLPERGLPPYRHVPGQTPHPRNHPDGHRHGDPDRELAVPPPRDWASCPEYLHALDLYNHGFWWEAHEAFEGLYDWSDPPQDLFFQGLLQLSLAALKRHMNEPRAAAHLADAGAQKLRRVQGSGDDALFMGLDLPALIHAVEAALGADGPFPLLLPG